MTWVRAGMLLLLHRMSWPSPGRRAPGLVAVASAAAAVAGALVYALRHHRGNRLFRSPPLPVTTTTPGATTGIGAYVIHTSKRRLGLFTRAYAASDMARTPLTRIDAGECPPEDDDLDGPGLTTPSAVRCYLGHLRAWGLIASSGAPHAFVFEDDAQIPERVLPGVERALREAVAQGPVRTWDLLLLGFSGEGIPVSPSLLRVDDFLMTHAYVITAEAARELSSPEGAMLPPRQRLDRELAARIHAEGLRVYGMRLSNMGVVSRTWG